MPGDNVTLNPGAGGSIVRSINRGAPTGNGPFVQVMALDLGGESGPENLVTGAIPVTLNNPSVQTIGANYAALQTNTVVVSPGAGKKLVVTRLTITTANGNSVDVTITIGLGTSATPTTTGVIFSHPGLANNQSVDVGDGSGVLGISATAGDSLFITMTVPTGGAVNVMASYYLQ